MQVLKGVRALALVAAVGALSAIVVSSAVGQRTADTINIGFLNALTGPYAVAGTPELAAAKLAITDVNNAGGVCNMKLNLAATADDQGQANLSVAGLRKLVQQDGLHLIIGPGITPPMRAIAPVAESLKTFVIGETAQRDPWKGRKYIFSGVTPQDVYAPLMVNYIAKKLGPGKHKVGILYANVPYAQSGYDLLKANLAKRGWPIVVNDNWDVSKFDFTSQAQKVAQANPEAVFLWGAATPADGQILKQLRAAGYQGPAATDLAYTLPFIPSVAGAAANTIVMPSQLNTFHPDAATKKFLTAYKKATKQPATFLSGQAYDDVKIIAAAVKKAGCKTDADSVSAAMVGLKYKGVTGSFAFTSGYHGGPQGKSFTEVAWKNGKQVKAS